MVGVSAFAGVPWAAAAENPVMYGEASVLDATILGLPLGDLIDVLLLNPVSETAPTGADGVTSELDGSALPALDVQIPPLGPIDVLGPDDGTNLVGLGLATNTVVLDPGGTSTATSDLTGVSINVGQFLAAVPLLSAAFSTLSLNVEAVDATSTAPTGQAPYGDTQIAGMTLDAVSPIIGALTQTAMTTVVPPIQTLLSAVTTVLNAAVPGATMSANLTTLLGPIFAEPFTGNGVTIDPRTGQIAFDLQMILGDVIADPPPNTALLDDEALTKLTTALSAALDSYTTQLVTKVTNAISAISMSFSPVLGTGLSGTATLGQVLGLPGAGSLSLLTCAPILGCSSAGVSALSVLTIPVRAAAGALPTVISTAVSALVNPLITTLSPALAVVNQVLAVTLNEQTVGAAEGDTFTTIALAVDVAPILGSPVALSLAKATIQGASLPYITSGDTVPAGGSTPVSGEGFTPGDVVMVQLIGPDGQPVGEPVPSPAVSDDGSFTMPFPVPADAAPGEYTIQATPPAGAPVTTPITVTAAPTLTPEFPTIPAGGTTTVTGAGFTPTGTDGLTVTLTPPAGSTAGPIEVPATVAADGSFTFVFPATTEEGPWTLSATDSSGALATATITVTAPPELTPPPAVAAGDTIAVPGTGFTPDGTVHVVVTAPDGTTVVWEGAVTADAAGAISASFPLDTDALAGTYTVAATDPTGAIATGTFAVANPALTTSPTADPGEAVPVGGTGFVPGETVSLQLTDPAGNLIGAAVEVVADENGAITLPADDANAIAIPPAAEGGVYTITATGQDSGGRASADVVVLNPVLIPDQTSLPVGGQTTVVGHGFTPGKDVTVTVTPPGGGTPVTTTLTADGTGSIEIPLQPASVGTWTIGATDLESGTPADPVTVEATVAALDAPASVPNGEDLPVTGTGFSPDAVVTLDLLYPDGTPVLGDDGLPITIQVTTDADGALPPDTVVPLPAALVDPGETPVVLTLKASDPTGAAGTTTTAVISPVVTVEDPARPGELVYVTPGEPVPVTGTSFTPDGTVLLTLLDANGQPVLTDGLPLTVALTASADGSLPDETTFPTVEGLSGGYSIQATDEATGTVVTSNTFLVVNPTITATDTPAGGSSIVTGTGFTPDGTVEIAVDGTDWTTTAQVNPDGTFTVRIPSSELPVTDPWQYSVTATDLTAEAEATAEFQVTEAVTAEALPPEVPSGGTSTVTGENFTPGSMVAVTITGPDGTTETTAPADSSGTVTVEVRTSPDDPVGGTYTVTLTDPSGASATETLTTTGAPSITASPEVENPLYLGWVDAQHGEDITVDGDGFLPGSTVTLKLIDPLGNLIETTTDVPVGTDGTFSGAILDVPVNSTGGTWTIRATDTSGATATNTLEFLNPTITASEPVVPGGGNVTIDGVGFLPGGENFPVEITGPDGTTFTADPATVSIEPDGTVTFILDTATDGVPWTPGEYTVTVRAASGATPKATFTVTAPPALDTAPTSVPGDTVEVTGTYFTPSTTEPASTATLTVTGPGGEVFTAEVPIDAGGQITTDFLLPADAPGGLYTVTAVDDTSGATAETSFVVVNPVLTAPATVAAGSVLPVSGTGFPPEATVTLTLTDSAGFVVTVPVQTDVAGNLLSTPALTALETSTGPATLTAAFSGPDGTVTLSTDVFITNPSISLTPAVMPAGGTTTISGSGFLPGTDVEITLTGTNGEVATVPVPGDAIAPDGTFTIDLTVDATTPQGGYTATATQTTAEAEMLTADAGLTVTAAPTLTLSADTVPAGGTVTVTGAGFTPGSTVEVLTAGTPQEVVANASGGFTVTMLAATTTALGPVAGGDPVVVPITATDVSGAIADTALTITAAPVVTLTPDTVARTGTATITGSGFTEGDVTIQVIDVYGVVRATVTGVVANADGILVLSSDPATPIPLDTTNLVAGTYTVRVTDGLRATDDAALTVTEAPTLTAPNVGWNETTTITGTGFAPGLMVDVYVVSDELGADGQPIVLLDTSVEADETGAISVQLTVPDGTEAGWYTATASDPTGATATDPLFVYHQTLEAPPLAQPGDVLLVVGEGFVAGDIVAIQLRDSSGAGITWPIMATADENGTVTLPLDVLADDALVVPAGTTPGAYTVAAWDMAMPDVVVSAPVWVSDPALSPVAQEVPAGGTAEILGTGFTPFLTGVTGSGEWTVAVTDPSSTVVAAPPVTITPTGDGTFTLTFATSADPATTEGTWTVSVTDEATGVVTTATITVTAAPTLTAPDAVAAGQPIPVTGTGFTPDSTVTLALLDGDGDPVLDGDGDPVTVTVATDGEGNLLPADAPLVAPGDLAAGTYTVKATDDATGAPAADTVTVANPVLDADPSAYAGEALPVSGTGFTPDGDVTLTLTDPAGVMDPITITVRADADGVIDTTFPVPATLPAGTYTLTALDTATETELFPGASDDDTVEITNAEITLTDGSIPAGGAITVEGTGFTPGGPVTVQLVGPDGPIGDAITTDATNTGTLSQEVATASTLLPGTYTVRVVDTTTGEVEELPLIVTDPPAIAVTWPTVPVGGSTLVTGSDFTANSPIIITLTDADGTAVLDGDGNPITITVTTDATGALPEDAIIDIPAGTPTGAYTLVAEDVSGATATTPLTVAPAPSLDAPATLDADAGAPLTVTGLGFTAGTDVTLELLAPDGTRVGEAVPVPSTIDGSITWTWVIPPETPGGLYTIRATDVTGATATDTTVFVNPSLTPVLTSVPASGSTTITGTGFTPGSTVTATLTADGADPVTVGPLPVGTDGSVTIPFDTTADTATGLWTITAVDAASQAAETTTITVTDAPAVTAPAAAAAGQPIPVTGTGFTPGGEVTLTLLDDASNPVLGPDNLPVTVTVTTDSAGALPPDTALTVPAAADAGAYTVLATDTTTRATATAELTVAAPTIDVVPDSTFAGASVPVTGSGFTPSSPVTLALLDSAGNPVLDADGLAVTAPATTDENGSLVAAALAIPANLPAGTYTVTAVDQATATSTFPGAMATDTVAITNAEVALTDDSVPAGGTTTVNGTGFTPGPVAVVVLDSAENIVIDGIDATADTGGQFSADIGTDGLEPGSYIVRVTDPVTGEVEDLVLVVTDAPELGATWPSVPAGGTTPLTGQNFTPDSEVTVTLTDADGTPILDALGRPITSTVTTDADGAFPADATFTVPAGTPLGDYQLVAVDESGATATTPLDVAALPIVIAPALFDAATGGPLDVTGSGFTVGEDVLVELLTSGGTVVAFVTVLSSDGSLAATLTVPADTAGGTYTVRATDVTGVMTIDTTVFVNPDLAPVLTSLPASGSTSIAGTGFTPNGTVSVTLTHATADPVILDNLVANEDGAVIIPFATGDAWATGPWTITAVDGASGAPATATITVMPAPVITAPDAVAAGQPIPVSGTGFTPDEPVTVTLLDPDGQPVVDSGNNPVTITVVATPDGTIPAGTVLTAPDTLAAGPYTLRAVDNTTQAFDTEPVAIANPTLTVTPDSVYAGEGIPVSGSGFTPDSPVMLVLLDGDGIPVRDPDGVAVSALTSTDTTGALVADAVLPTPDWLPAGTYTVQALDTATQTPTFGGAVVEDDVVVTNAAITLSDDSVPAGGSTTVTGAGFTPGPVTLELVSTADGSVTLLPDATADAEGGFTAVVGTDGLEPGTYTVRVTDPVTGEVEELPLTITAAPQLTAAPATLPAGGTTTITGTGFTPGSTVTLTATTGLTVPVSATADADGVISFTVPTTAQTAPTAYTVTATDTSGAVATTTVTVTAAPTVDAPSAIPAGTTMTVASTGLTSGEVTYVVTTPDGATTLFSGTAPQAADGSIAIPIPADAPLGDAIITVTDSTGAAASDTFEIVETTLEVADTSVPVGDPFDVTGSGFVPGETVTITLTSPDGTEVLGTVTAVANDDGTITATLPTTGLPAGPYTVTATAPSGVTDSVPVALTDPSITVTDPSVPAGGTVPVDGTGFTPGEAVTVTVTNAAGTTIAETTVTVGPDGTFSTTVDIPATTQAGDYTVTALGDDTNALATDTVTITEAPAVIVPPTVAAGETLAVTGTGFTPGATVSVTLTGPGGAVVGPVEVTASATGDLIANLPIPATATPGTYTVTATDPSGAVATGATWVGAPEIALDPPRLLPGDSTTVTGEGYLPGEQVTIELTGADGATVGDPVTATADVGGAFTADLPVPADTDPGLYTATATGEESQFYAEWLGLWVMPSPTVTVPAQVEAGATLPVTGRGFAPNEPVTITVTGPDGTVIATVQATADQNGNVSASVPVPADAAAGTYTVGVVDEYGIGATAPVEVTRTATPTVTIPDSVAAGTDLPVTGEGFAPRETVTVQVKDAQGNVVAEVTATADGNGAISTTVPIPAATVPGDYQVVVKGGTSGAVATAPLTVTARELTAWFSQPTVYAGDVQQFHAGGFEPGEEVHAVIRSTPLELPATVADADGVAHWTFLVPADFELGEHSGVATSGPIRDSANATFQVIARGAVGGGGGGGFTDTTHRWYGMTGPLPRTGSDPVLPLLLTGGLLLLGAALAATSRLRQRRPNG